MDGHNPAGPAGAARTASAAEAVQVLVWPVAAQERFASTVHGSDEPLNRREQVGLPGPEWIVTQTADRGAHRIRVCDGVFLESSDHTETRARARMMVRLSAAGHRSHHHWHGQTHAQTVQCQSHWEPER